MKPKIIQTPEEHQEALRHVESLMDAGPGSAQEQELDLWALLIERYEQEQFPIEAPDPIEAIKFRMDQLGLSRKDLESCIGPKSKVSEVLNRRRALSLTMIRKLHNRLGIPAGILVQAVPEPRKPKPTRPKSSQATSTSSRNVKKQTLEAR